MYNVRYIIKYLYVQQFKKKPWYADEEEYLIDEITISIYFGYLIKNVNFGKNGNCDECFKSCEIFAKNLKHVANMYELRRCVFNLVKLFIFYHIPHMKFLTKKFIDTFSLLILLLKYKTKTQNANINLREILIYLIELWHFATQFSQRLFIFSPFQCLFKIM